MRTLIILIALAGTAIAETRQPRSVLFRWENDSFGFLTGESTDDNYTNGLRLDIGSIADPWWARRVEDVYCRTSLCGEAAQRTRRVLYGFTHQFYTPARIDIISRRPDRPWAGLMFVSATLRLDDGPTLQHVLEGQLGILGQAAGAHYIQSRWHQFIGYEVQPIGWPNQLRNEPIANVTYSYNRRVPLISNRADVIASPGLALGTLTSYPTVGATLRIGHNLAGFPTDIIEPSAALSAKTFDAFLLAGADVRYVLNNATLDGGFFRDGPSVERENLIRDIRLGGSIRVHSFRLSYTIVRRSEEFTERRSAQTFHSIAVGYAR